MSLPKNGSASHGRCICINGRFDESISEGQSGYDYIDNSRCKPCSIGCSQCDGIGLDGVCIKCNGNLLQNFKTCYCAEGKTLNADQGSCNNCWVTCSKCEGNGLDKCTSCKDEKMGVIKAIVNRNRLLTIETTGHCLCKVGSFDLENITPGVFTDYVTEESRCKDCSHGCSSCTNSGLEDVCNTCVEPLIHKKETNEDGGQIITKTCICRDGFYLKIDAEKKSSCPACHVSCSTCSGGSDVDCLNCTDSKMRVSMRKEGQSGLCVCKKGKYDNST
jgi:proprotein convertase subtilisin/kexin type 5